LKQATAFAPATVANVAVGFDLLGFPIQSVGDTVTVSRTDALGVTIQEITGLEAEGIPRDSAFNTATVGLLQLLKDQKAKFGLNVSIQKGIPLSSGMGGSAASAVAGILAANTVLECPLPREKLLHYAMLGESKASGSMHADNVVPCLFGGLTFCSGGEEFQRIQVPVPAQIRCVLVHPKFHLDTKVARAILKSEVSLRDHVHQSAYLAGFLAGCFQNNLELIRQSFCDVIIEPQRASLIPDFRKVQAAAISEGALGCSISGAGPSIFAWADSEASAESIRRAMVNAFQQKGEAPDSWVSPISSQGAQVL